MRNRLASLNIRKRYIVIAVVAVVLIIVALFFAQSVSWYSAQVVAKEGGSPIGIAPFTDRLDFGELSPGTSITKKLTLDNNSSIDNYIVIFIMGGVGDLVSIEPSSFTLREGEAREVDFKLFMPASAEPDQVFSGNVVIMRFPKGLW